MNIKTITTVDGVNVVDFGSAASRFYWIENLGSTTVYVSGNENIVPDGDNVKVLSAGCGTMVENLGGKVYILGAGKFQITNQGDKFPPFRNAPVADGGVMASGNPVTLDGLQGGVPFSEITVRGDDIVGQELTVNVSGKNLIPYPYSRASGTYNGIELTVHGDGRFDMSGTATASFAILVFAGGSSPIYLSGGQTYTISCNTPYDLSKFNLSARVYHTDGNYMAITKFPTTFVAKEGDYLTSTLWIDSDVSVSAKNVELQLELGDTATEYEPYHGSTTTITPTSNPYIIPNDIRQVDGLNNISVSEGEISVTGVRKNAAVKKIWDKIDELTTAIIVSNGETIE